MGGAAGHMNHPFDLGWVDTGTDLLDFFERAKGFVEKKGAGAVKIDGVNVSFKVVETPDGHEFAVDRGSLKNVDIEGITMNRIDDRFPEGHGMRPAIRTLLTILNQALPSIKSELDKLGMWDDPSLFLNTEYVEGTTNVTEYDENFLAIHGLNQFYQRVAKSGASKGNLRPGATRPEGVKTPSVEMPYDPKVMEKLIKKLNPVANEYGFQVYGSVPTERIGDLDIDFSNTLNSPFTVQVSGDREITKSLGEWLSEVSNPRYKTVKLKNGKKTHPLHKELYKAILDGSVPIVDLIEDSDAEAAIYGAIIMHATRMLGNDILNGLTSPMGDVMSHEGVVLRDEEIFGPNPVKITGEFIVGGMGSAFQADTSLNEEDEDDDPVVDSDFSKTVAVVPGAFKPPHKGHLDMVRKYADFADEVKVLISRPLSRGRKLPNGREITADDSLKMWNVLASDIPNVDIEISTHASPINAAYEYVGEEGPLNTGDKVILGCSEKDCDWKRWVGADKYIKSGVELVSPRMSAVSPSTRPNGEPYSASDLRNALGDPLGNRALIGEFVGEENVDAVLDILDLSTGIEEISAMGGGAVSGPGRPAKRDNEEQEKLIKHENIDLSIVDDVIRLIMEKGIAR
tara:strand:- start:2113 stop:3990 length:1878 start_codon:yes stop_codon:yes gene_type:complete